MQGVSPTTNRKGWTNWSGPPESCRNTCSAATGSDRISLRKLSLDGQHFASNRDFRKGIAPANRRAELNNGRIHSDHPAGDAPLAPGWFSREPIGDPQRFSRESPPLGIPRNQRLTSDAPEHPLCPTTPGHCLSLKTHRTARQAHPRRTPQLAACGVKTEPPPASVETTARGIQGRNIVAGETGRGKPLRRMSGGGCGRSRCRSSAARCRGRRRLLSAPARRAAQPPGKRSAQ